MANVGKVWNGTAWVDLGSTATFQSAGTATVGVVQLTDSTSSTSTTTAATPNSVKSAYDLAGTAIPKNTVTAAGDILYASGSATVTRLGIGTANQVLSVSAGVPAWTTPAGGGGMTCIGTATPSGASTVSFTNIPNTYKHLMLIVAEAYQDSTSGSWSLRFNNSSSDYNWNGISIATSNDVGAETSGNALPGLGYHNHAPIQRTTSTSTTYDRHGRAHVLICRYSEAENKTVFWTSQGYAQSSIGYNSAICSGQWRDTTAIDRVDLVRNATQTVTGTIYLYGVS